MRIHLLALFISSFSWVSSAEKASYLKVRTHESLSGFYQLIDGHQNPYEGPERPPPALSRIGTDPRKTKKKLKRKQAIVIPKGVFESLKEIEYISAREYLPRGDWKLGKTHDLIINEDGTWTKLYYEYKAIYGFPDTDILSHYIRIPHITSGQIELVDGFVRFDTVDGRGGAFVVYQVGEDLVLIPESIEHNVRELGVLEGAFTYLQVAESE